MTDPLSDLFALVHVDNVRCTRLEAAGAWSVQFPANPLLKFVAVLRGTCWVILAGAEPRQVSAGDVFLLLDAPSYVVASQPGLPPTDGTLLYADADTAHLGGAATVLLGGGFTAGGEDARLLLDVLPGFLRIDGTDPNAAKLRDTVALIDAELGGGLGADIAVRRLADVLIIQALRAYAANTAGADLGWLGALGDRHIGMALRLMHRDPGHAWTVAALAAESGLSRSGFAARFKQAVGRAPLEYLRRWRMLRARIDLETGNVPIAHLAVQLGYDSERAFRAAFRRMFGRSPKQHAVSVRSRAASRSSPSP
ncbi:AraC family transcriptional regulator [Croceibacterium ferulae]|uniref:AraC family transcriptional regulator n=1 Tax=Croceibacterium ferulae TaxID=1854641 RepID=UPI000EAFEA08|nr:AraC family transcriptional regulator [Croceibacterium ferulae]